MAKITIFDKSGKAGGLDVDGLNAMPESVQRYVHYIRGTNVTKEQAIEKTKSMITELGSMDIGNRMVMLSTSIGAEEMPSITPGKMTYKPAYLGAYVENVLGEKGVDSKLAGEYAGGIKNPTEFIKNIQNSQKGVFNAALDQGREAYANAKSAAEQQGNDFQEAGKAAGAAALAFGVGGASTIGSSSSLAGKPGENKNLAAAPAVSVEEKAKGIAARDGQAVTAVNFDGESKNAVKTPEAVRPRNPDKGGSVSAEAPAVPVAPKAPDKADELAAKHGGRPVAEVNFDGPASGKTRTPEQQARLDAAAKAMGNEGAHGFTQTPGVGALRVAEAEEAAAKTAESAKLAGSVAADPSIAMGVGTKFSTPGTAASLAAAAAAKPASPVPPETEAKVADLARGLQRGLAVKGGGEAPEAAPAPAAPAHQRGYEPLHGRSSQPSSSPEVLGGGGIPWEGGRVASNNTPSRAAASQPGAAPAASGQQRGYEPLSSGRTFIQIQEQVEKEKMAGTTKVANNEAGINPTNLPRTNAPGRGAGGPEFG